MLTLSCINRRNTLRILSYSHSIDAHEADALFQIEQTNLNFCMLSLHYSERSHIRRRKVLSIYRHPWRGWKVEGEWNVLAFLLYSSLYKSLGQCNFKTTFWWRRSLLQICLDVWELLVYKSGIFRAPSFPPKNYTYIDLISIFTERSTLAPGVVILCESVLT